MSSMMKGFRLPGMVNVDQSVSSGANITPKLEGLLSFSTAQFVKVFISRGQLDGEVVEADNASRQPERKLQSVRNVCSKTSANYFVLFGYDEGGFGESSSFVQKGKKKCLLVSFIPDGIKVKDKMLMSASKGILKKKIALTNTECMIEEYNCSELKEISEEAYTKKKNIDKPFTEAEKLRMEEDKMEKGISFIDRLKEVEKGNSNAYALPGFGIGMKPSEIKKNRGQSMKLALEKDGERKEKINAFVKLHELQKNGGDGMDMKKALEEAEKALEDAIEE